MILTYKIKHNQDFTKEKIADGRQQQALDFIRILKEKDTYSMEFLKECLPEEARSLDDNAYHNGFNRCREIVLNNANNKQDEKNK